DFVGVMKLSSVANGTSRLSGSSLRTILPSRSAGFCTVAVQPKRTDPQLQAGRLFPDPKRCADQKQSTGNDRCPGERTHAELTEDRWIAAKNHCSYDQNHDGNKGSQCMLNAASVTPELRYSGAIIL